MFVKKVIRKTSEDRYVLNVLIRRLILIAPTIPENIMSFINTTKKMDNTKVCKNNSDTLESMYKLVIELFIDEKKREFADYNYFMSKKNPITRDLMYEIFGSDNIYYDLCHMAKPKIL